MQNRLLRVILYFTAYFLLSRTFPGIFICVLGGKVGHPADDGKSGTAGVRLFRRGSSHDFSGECTYDDTDWAYSLRCGFLNPHHHLPAEIMYTDAFVACVEPAKTAKIVPTVASLLPVNCLMPAPLQRDHVKQDNAHEASGYWIMFCLAGVARMNPRYPVPLSDLEAGPINKTHNMR